MKFISFLVLALMANNVFSSDLPRVFKDFHFVEKNEIDYLVTGEEIVFKYGKYSVVKSQFNKNITSEGVYFLKVRNYLDRDLLKILSLGSIVDIIDDEAILFKLNNKDDIKVLSYYAHKLNNSCGSIIKINDTPVTNLGSLRNPKVAMDKKIDLYSELKDKVSAVKIREAVQYYVSIENRYSGTLIGKELPYKIQEKYMDLANKYGRKVEVDFIPFRQNSQESIIVRLVGKKKPKEIVVLGHHIDNICHPFSGCRGGRYFGEDDNASGMGAHFEIFRILVENNIEFERTVEIHGYAAEEHGLLGSAKVARKYTGIFSSKKVIAMLQNDMILHNPYDDVRIRLDKRGSTDLNNKLMVLSKNYLPEIETFIKPVAGSSDHISWLNQGIHAVFPFEDHEFPSIHTGKDHNDKHFDYDQSAVFTRLSLLFTLHYAGGFQASSL